MTHTKLQNIAISLRLKYNFSPYVYSAAVSSGRKEVW